MVHLLRLVPFKRICVRLPFSGCMYLVFDALMLNPTALFSISSSCNFSLALLALWWAGLCHPQASDGTFSGDSDTGFSFELSEHRWKKRVKQFGRNRVSQPHPYSHRYSIWFCKSSDQVCILSSILLGNLGNSRPLPKSSVPLYKRLAWKLSRALCSSISNAFLKSDNDI